MCGSARNPIICAGFVDVSWVQAKSLGSAKTAQGCGPPRQAVEEIVIGGRIRPRPAKGS